MQINANTASAILLFFATLAVNGAPIDKNVQDLALRATPAVNFPETRYLIERGLLKTKNSHRLQLLPQGHLPHHQRALLLQPRPREL